MATPADHAQVQKFLGGSMPLEVRCLVLQDRIVECEVEVQFLVDRVLDPLTQGVLNCLPDNSREGIAMNRVVDALGLQAEAEVNRLIGTILHILTLSNYVGRTDAVLANGNTLFWRTTLSASIPTGARYQVLQPSVQYVPRSGQMGSWIPGVGAPKLEDVLGFRGRFDRGWQPPDENELYSDDNLSKRIPAAYLSNPGSARIPYANVEGDLRVESLQRSRLISIKPQIIQVSLAKHRPINLERYILHRCYLSRSAKSRGEDWRIVVLWLDAARREHGYSRYLRDLVQLQPFVIDSLLDVSQALGIWN